MKRAIDAGMPRSTRIMGQRFSVTSVPGLTVATGDIAEEAVKDEWVHEGRMHVLGACDRDDLTIELETDTGHDKFRETFVHEHLHAMIGKTGMSNDILHGIEEAMVSRLAPVLLQFLRDNPRAIEFLTDRLQGGAKSARVYW